MTRKIVEWVIAVTILTAIFICGIWVADQHKFSIKVVDCQGQILGGTK